MFGTRKSGESSYQDILRDSLERLPITAAPAPWKLVGGSYVGGVTGVGFVPDTDDILVVSSEGRSVFDSLSATRIASNPVEIFGDDPRVPRQIAPAIGKHAGVLVHLAGMHGGGLSRFTEDGWSIDVIQLPWPKHVLFLSSDYLPVAHATGHVWKLCDDHPYTFRAAGFSPTGRTFVFATSGEILIYSRE